MSRIIELPEVLANQIAAGEVIERPASVVKELLENAIDAQASQIQIAVEEAGLKSITITDNGHGIASDDVELALHRHATSKIKNQADLFRIRTLGFRGEALASIVSVGHLTIETASKDEQAGTRLVARGGEIESKTIMSRSPGTTMKVAELFFNTPARLKYMKSPQAELSHIVDVVNRLSLAHPEISFTLINDGRELMRTAGTGDLHQAIAGIYGLATAKKMVAIEAGDLDFEVQGYVSLPELTRANRNYITLLINGRYIKNFLLNRAILEGYGSKLMVGRFPVAVIDIRIDPYLADVNVHPTKQEVRISKEQTLMALISQAIAARLSQEQLIPDALENLAKTAKPKLPKAEQTVLPLKSTNLYYDTVKQDFFVKDENALAERPQFDVDNLVNKEDETVNLIDKEVKPTLEVTQKSGPSVNVKQASRQIEVDKDRHHPQLNHQELAQAVTKLDQELASDFPELEYFGQMHGTYLFAQGQGGLYIIDQHAAQERVKYEYYRDKIGEVDNSQQQLLVPYLFDFPANDLLALQERQAHLQEVGLHLEPYGPTQLILREHPIWLKAEEVEAAVYEMCDMLLLTKQVSVKQYRAELAIMMSCKGSIKANHALDDYSARDLLTQLAQCKNPYNCPHGRPVLVNFTKSDMEKMFRRIQENHTSLRELGKYE